MRISVDIDDNLITEAMAVTGLATKKATVKTALRRLVQRRQRLDALAEMAGLGWDGDLLTMRTGYEPQR